MQPGAARELAAGDHELGQAFDLARYPIHAPSSPECRRLIAEARTSLDNSGAFVLEGFMRPASVAAILAEADAMAKQAFASSQPHNVYLLPTDPALAES